MTYEEFKFKIIDQLQTDIPDPKSVSVQPVTRNNGCVLDGLVIMESGLNIAPTIYLDPYYEEYEDGVTFQDIYDQILSVYQKNRPTDNVNVRFFTDYENVRTKIAYKLIHRQRNEALLHSVPYRPFLDLAIVFYCLVDLGGSQGSGTILIHHSHLKYWGITEDALFELAEKNTPRLLRQSLRDIYDVIDNLGKAVPSEHNHLFPRESMICDRADPAMYILSNSENLFGASCLLYHGLLAKYAKQLNTDFYILPSSVHEVILVPTSEQYDICQMSEMVASVNASALLPEEILSDHAYYYSRETDTITM